MSIGIDHVRNRAAGMRVANPGIDHAGPTPLPSKLRVPRAPLHRWTLLLLVIVIALASQTFPDDRPTKRSDAARPLPLLLMMTENPQRRGSH